MAQDVVVGIGAQPDLAAGLADATGQLDTWARTTGSRVEQGFGRSASSISKFKESLSRSREAAMFFTASLRNFGPSGQVAQMAISGMTGALIAGTGPLAAVLLALEGARIVTSLVGGSFREAAEAAKKLADESRRVADNLQGVIEKRAVLLAEMGGDETLLAQTEAAMNVAAQRRAVADLQAKLAEKQKEYAEWYASAFRIEATGKNLKTEIANLNTQLDAAYIELANVTDKGELEIGRVVKKHADERTRQEEQDQRKRVEAAKRHAEEMKRALQAAHARDTSGASTVAGFYALESSAYDPAAMAKAEVDAFTKAMADGRAVFEATRTPAEMYAREIERLGMLLQAGAIDEETFARAVDRAAAAFVQANAKVREFTEMGVGAFFDLVRAADEGADAIAAVWENLANQILHQIQRIVTEWLVAQLAMGGGGSGGLGGLITGAVGGGVQAPVEIGPGKFTPGVAPSNLSPAPSAKAGAVSVSLYVQGDVVDPQGWFAKNEGALAAAVSSAIYKGRIG